MYFKEPPYPLRATLYPTPHVAVYAIQSQVNSINSRFFSPSILMLYFRLQNEYQMIFFSLKMPAREAKLQCFF